MKLSRADDAEAAFSKLVAVGVDNDNLSTNNQRLSLVRAQRIQAIMQRAGPAVPRRSKAIGKGFAEIIVGSGTDDARDALDRRVEFAVVGCQ